MGSSNITIVTAADASYVRSLRQLLRDFERFRSGGAERFVIYDLGLGALAEDLAREYPLCEWRSIAFASLPAHAQMTARTYAWKPVVVHAACSEFGGKILWIDSACLLRRPLGVAEALIERYHVVTLAGQSAIAERCDSEVLDHLEVSRLVRSLPERAAGVIGIDADNSSARFLVGRWRQWVDDPTKWRPRSPNHMPEQALLSILVYESVLQGSLELSPGEIDISSPRPVDWISTRNKVPAWLPEAAEGLSRRWYAFYKAADQWVWRRRLSREPSEAERRLMAIRTSTGPGGVSSS